MCRDAVAAPRALQLIVYPISLKKSLLFCEKIEKINEKLNDYKIILANPFEYFKNTKFDFKTNEEEFLDFKIKMIKANNKILECENGEYTDIIELENINELIEFTIVVEWQSNDDEEDTIKGIETGDLSIPINVRVEQYCE